MKDQKIKFEELRQPTFTVFFRVINERFTSVMGECVIWTPRGLAGDGNAQ